MRRVDVCAGDVIDGLRFWIGKLDNSDLRAVGSAGHYHDNNCAKFVVPAGDYINTVELGWGEYHGMEIINRLKFRTFFGTESDKWGAGELRKTITMPGAWKGVKGFGGEFMDTLAFTYWKDFQIEFDEDTIKKNWAIFDTIPAAGKTVYKATTTIETSFSSTYDETTQASLKLSVGYGLGGLNVGAESELSYAIKSTVSAAQK